MKVKNTANVLYLLEAVPKLTEFWDKLTCHSFVFLIWYSWLIVPERERIKKAFAGLQLKKCKTCKTNKSNLFSGKVPDIRP
jgi:hypothetical protein